MRVWLPLSSRPVVQRSATDLTSYDPAFLGLAARLQPGVQPSQTLPTVEAIGARSMQLTTDRDQRDAIERRRSDARGKLLSPIR